MTSEYERGTSGRELAGLLIILIGFGLLMNTMGIFPIFPFFPLIQRFWLPAIFIGIGVLLLSRRGNEGIIGGVFFILFGFLFFLHGVSWGPNVTRLIGPMILIWVGIAFLTRGTGPRRVRTGRGRDFVGQRRDFAGTTAHTDSSDYVHATVILGGFNRKCSSQQFRGGDLTAVMGGGKIDLRDARIQQDEAVLDIFTLMGGIEIQVPRGWVVEPRFTPVLGGYEDRTNPEKEGTKRLAIQGTTILGGVIVSN